jgi:hypothetical protein
VNELIDLFGSESGLTIERNQFISHILVIAISSFRPSVIQEHAYLIILVIDISFFRFLDIHPQPVRERLRLRARAKPVHLSYPPASLAYLLSILDIQEKNP